MIKKLIIGGLVTILVGVLGAGVYGYAQNFDALPATRAAADGSEDNRSHPPSNVNDGEGYRGGRGEAQVSPRFGNGDQASGERGCEEVTPGGQHKWEPQAHVEDWSILGGELVSLDTSGLTLRTDDGQSVTLQLGPEWFWSKQVESLVPGEHVTVLAFEEDGELKAGQISLEGGGYVLQLRDADGRPLWAGRGRGDNRW
jgi:hypothetical protein